MIKEFIEFIKRGNILFLAVAVIMADAFSPVVQSMVRDIISPIIGIIVGKSDLSDSIILWLSKEDGSAIRLGMFIQLCINFLIVALAVFLILKAYTKITGEQMEKK
jgi:large conductance mechanosensitive channel